jgi:hypothetical protein
VRRAITQLAASAPQDTQSLINCVWGHLVGGGCVLFFVTGSILFDFQGGEGLEVPLPAFLFAYLPTNINVYRAINLFALTSFLSFFNHFFCLLSFCHFATKQHTASPLRMLCVAHDS